MSDIEPRSLDLNRLENFSKRLRTDREFLNNFKANPINELKNLGIHINAESEIGRQLQQKARSLGEKVGEQQAPVVRGRCLIIGDGTCIIIHQDPDITTGPLILSSP
jgi:hypothetical protein